LEPAAGIGGNRDEIDGADRVFDGFKKFRALAIEAIGDDVLEREHALVAQLPHHRHGSLGLGLKSSVVGPLALGSAARIGVGQPRL
jgi:hypothetical protein